MILFKKPIFNMLTNINTILKEVNSEICLVQRQYMREGIDTDRIRFALRKLNRAMGIIDGTLLKYK